MMPNLDGFGLLAGLQADPATTGVPVIMVSARAGEDGTIEGLEAGADDYLVKPFAARELLARVQANIELDRARRTRDALRRSGDLLDQAQRLARSAAGTSTSRGHAERFRGALRQLQMSAEELHESASRASSTRACTPRMPSAWGALAAAAVGAPLDLELRLSRRTARARLSGDRRARARRAREPVRLRGSLQDVTEQKAAERALALAAAEREAAARERLIADELQHSLLPERTFAAEQLEVAAYYRAGVAGTQVGGDWST